MHPTREAWLDSLRGITISLVILNHSVQATRAVLSGTGTQLPDIIHTFNQLLGLVRMPAFFLCSGILFAAVARRGWRSFARKRLLWAAWIAVLWGSISVAVIESGLKLNPLDPSEGTTVWQRLLIEPIGNMWFIYAVAILGAFCMCIRGLRPSLALGIAAIASLVVIYLVERASLPQGIGRTLWNLGVRGLLFFTIGFVFSQQLIKPRKGDAVAFFATLILWAACFYALRKMGGGTYSRMVLDIPATFCAIYALQFCLARASVLSIFFSALGQQSLELFLLHQFAIALAAAGFHTFGGVSPSFILASIFVTTMAVSLAAARGLRLIPGNIAFAVPLIGRKPQGDGRGSAPSR